MSYKVTEEGNISTVFLNGEIDMDVTDKGKRSYFAFRLIWKGSSFKLKRCFIHGLSGISVLIESHQKH